MCRTTSNISLHLPNDPSSAAAGATGLQRPRHLFAPAVSHSDWGGSVLRQPFDSPQKRLDLRVLAFEALEGRFRELFHILCRFQLGRNRGQFDLLLLIGERFSGEVD
jgi:hypothetical protein